MLPPMLLDVISNYKPAGGSMKWLQSAVEQRGRIMILQRRETWSDPSDYPQISAGKISEEEIKTSSDNVWRGIVLFES